MVRLTLTTATKTAEGMLRIKPRGPRDGRAHALFTPIFGPGVKLARGPARLRPARTLAYGLNYPFYGTLTAAGPRARATAHRQNGPVDHSG